MSRAWPLLALAALLGGQPTPAFAQLKVTEKTTVKLQLPDVPHLHFNDLVLAPDGRLVAAKDSELDISSVFLLDARTGKEQVALRAHVSAITCVAFNSDGTLLATGGFDGTVKVWDLRTRKQSAVLRGFFEPTGLAFSPDGKTLVTAGRSVLPDGRRRDPDMGVVRLWDVGAGKERANLICPVHELNPLHRLQFSPNGKRLLTGSDGGYYLWDLDAEQLVTKRLPDYNCVFSPDSKYLVGHSSGNLHLRDGETGKEKWAVETQGSPLAFSPDGGVLAVQNKGDVELVEVETGKTVATLKGASAGAQGFSADGKTLVALVQTDKETAIKTWELTWEKGPGK